MAEERPPVTADSIGALWRQASGDGVTPKAIDQLSIEYKSKKYELSDIRISDIEGPADSVALEFYFPDAKAMKEETLFGKMLGDKVVELVGNRLRVDFRHELQKKKDAAEARAKQGLQGQADAEGGDEKEEKWKAFLRNPAPDMNWIVMGTEDAGPSRRVLAVRASMSPACAQALGKVAAPNVFLTEDDYDEREIEFGSALYCIYIFAGVILCVFVLWIVLFTRAMYKSRKIHQSHADEL